jgi:gas vesicle protein
MAAMKRQRIQKEEKPVTSDNESKSTHFFLGLALGAIGGLVTAILAHGETREALRERSEKSLDYLNQQAGKLRDSADVLVQQGKKLIACKSSESVDRSTVASKQAYQEEKRENLGG